jgi:hypothetical protein
MPTIMEYLGAFGLAGGAGAKAFVPVLVLGLLHHTKYFELSPQFQWMASVPVLAILAALLLVEIWLDSHPDLGPYHDVVAYLPKFVAGCLAFAAATGTLDESLGRLAASGILGGTTAVGVHWLGNRVRAPVRELSVGIHEGIGKVFSWSEAGVAAGVSLLAVLVPLLAVGLLLAAFGTGFTVAHLWSSRRTACVHCGEPVRPGATVCPHCRQEQG